MNSPTSRFRASARHEGSGHRRTNIGQRSGGLGAVDVPMRHIHIIRLKAVTRAAEIGAGDGTHEGRPCAG